MLKMPPPIWALIYVLALAAKDEPAERRGWAPV